MPDAINTLPAALRRIPMSEVNATSKTTPCFDSAQTQSNLSAVDVTQVAADRLGYGLQFNGSTSRIDVPADATLFSNIIKHDFAISVWVNISKIGTGVVIFDATKDGNNFVQICILSTGQVYVYHRYDGGRFEYTTTQAVLKPNTWYHIAVVNIEANNAPEQIYINGQLASSESSFLVLKAPESYAGTSGKIAIGSKSNQALHFPGSMALFRLFDRVLDSAQVRAIIAQDQAGLRMRLPLDEIPTDGSLTVTGATVVPDDQLGGCLKFDGVDDYAGIALPSALSNLATQEFTITLWIRGSDLSGKTIQTCLLDATKDANNFVQLYVPTSPGSKLEFVVKSAGNQYRKLSNTLVQGQWVHVALVWNGKTSTARLYVDGQEATTAGVGTAVKGTDGSFHLARRSSGNGHFKGSLAHARIYDRALAVETIKQVRTQDLVATQTFLTEYPLSFVLAVDESAKNALYIANDGITNKFTLEVTNDSNQEIKLEALTSASAEASSDAYHFELNFKAQTFEKGSTTDPWNYLKAALSDTNWIASKAQERTDGKISVYLRYAGVNPLQLSPGQTISFPFEYQSAGSSGGARGTTIQLRCAKLYLGSSATPMVYSRIQSADIINRRGLREVPLRVGIVGSNTILNDANPAIAASGSAGTVTIRIANTLEKVSGYPNKNRLAFNCAPSTTSNTAQNNPGTDLTQFTLVFEDPVGNDWDLATSTQLAAIVVSANEGGSISTYNITSTTQGTNSVFKFTPKRSFLGPGEWIDLKLTNIRTSSASGLANIIVKYEDLPGYQDGQFTVQVEKTPIVHVKDKVGIGTADPQCKLDVRGTGSFEKIGIGTTSPSKPLSIVTDGKNFADINLLSTGDGASYVNFGWGNQTRFAIGGAGYDEGHDFRLWRYNQSYSTVMTVAGATGNVGIGTTAPATRLHVSGSSDVSVGTGKTGIVTIGDAAGEHIAIDSNEIMAKESGTKACTLLLQHEGGSLNVGAGKLFVNASGNVGIGTTAPDYRLDVAGSISTDDYLIHNGDDNTKIGFPSNDEILMATSGYERLKITSGGNVGIGVTNPSTPLHVNGGSWVDAGKANTGILILGNSAGLHLGLSADAIQAKKDGDEAGKLHLNTGGGDVQIRQNIYVTGDTVGLAAGGYNRLYVSSNGNVGIGTTNPYRAGLDIQKYDHNWKKVDDSEWRDRIYPQYHHVDGYVKFSIYADDGIAAYGFFARSDERIKDVRGRSEATKDLELLEQIEITDYTHKDRLSDGGRPHKKVIGQQIAKVFPQAVNTHTDVIPDILQPAKLDNGYLSLQGVSVAKGDKLRLIFAENNGAELLEVQANDAGRIKVDSDRSGDVFVYGREVNDFHEVDYDALSMLNISATQALAREVETLQRENQYLRSATLEMRQDLDRILAQLNAKNRKS